MTKNPSHVLQAALSPYSDRFDLGDERWAAQVNDLYAELLHEVGTFRREATPADGAKGVVESAILALGSAGAFHAAVACLRVWLERDRTRNVQVTWRIGDDEESIVLRTDGVDDETFGRWEEAARRKIGGDAWPDRDIERS